VWANAPRDALRTLHHHDRAWQHPECKHIAIWEDNHKGDPIDGLVHWVVDSAGHPINGAVPEARFTATAPEVATQTSVARLEEPTFQEAGALVSVPAAVQSGAYIPPLPVPAPAAYPVADRHNGMRNETVARETPHATQTNLTAPMVAQLAAELDALKAYIKGQTLADLAFQEHALLEHAKRSGDVQLIKSAEASAASSFGPDWRTRIPALLDKGRALDAAALQSA
jgi:hypothetical protein